MRRLVLLLLLSSASLSASPTKHDVRSGDVSISSQNNTTTIHQHTDKAVIHWEDFSIQHGEKVQVFQPSKKGALLNRVTGKNPSEIYGSLSSNGKVFLLNKNGIFIGPEGRIDTAGFIASTLELEDRQFMTGDSLLFSGCSEASIVNLGRIETHGGDLFVLARRVENHGVLKANEGIVGIAGATEVILKEDSPEQIYIRPQAKGTVTNEGTIEGVQAILKAAGDNAYALALNQKGIVQATGVKIEDGKVLLIAETGVTQVSGTLQAKNEDGSGGTVHVLGDQVWLVEEGIVDVSAKTAGGEVLLGGDYQGKNPTIKNAEHVFVSRNAEVLAQSEEDKGGRVIIWGDKSAQYYGAIDVSGPSAGGFIEVSSPDYLCYRGNVDLSSKWGEPGELLLDPSDITIGNFGGSSNPSFPTSPNEYNPPGSSGQLAVANLMNGLNSGNVTLLTSGGSGGRGHVLFPSGINLTWNAATTFSIVTSGEIDLRGNTIQNTHTGTGNFNAIDFQANITGSAFDGITIQNTTITSVEGNISLTGANASSSSGIFLSNSFTNSTGTGPDSATITINGTSNGGLFGSFGVNLRGHSINSVDGDISITGSGDYYGFISQGFTISSTGTTANAANISLVGTGTNGLSAAGIYFINDDFSIEASAGDIFLEGTSDGTPGIEMQPTPALAQIGSATMTGDITIRASSVDLTNPLQILGLGTLTIEPSDPTLTVGVGGGLTGTQDLYLSNLTLNHIQDGFAERIFGRTDGTGTFDIGNRTYADPVTMISRTGNMTVHGALATSGGSAINLASDNMSLNSSVTGTGTLTLEPGQTSTTIGVGNGAFGTFNLDSTEISQITNGFSEIIIGRTDQNSSVDIRAITFQDPLTVYGNEISVNGALNAGANNVTFNIGPTSPGILNLDTLVTTTGTFQVNGGGFDDVFSIAVAGQTATLDGGGGLNVLGFSSGTNTWSISSTNGGTVGGLTFSNMNHLEGGTGNDDFIFGGMFQINGPGIDGGGGTNSVTGPNAVTSWTVTGNNAGTIDTGGGITPLTNIQTFTGGNNSDSFLFIGDHQLTSIDGGTGTNSVTGPNTVTTWGITGSTTGTINPGSGSTNLTNIQTFIGGSNDDTFNLSPDITIPTIQAGGGNNTLTFLGGWTLAALIDLNTTTDFQTINGPGTVGSSLTGNNLANTWHITNDDSGTLENTTYPLGDLFNFTGFPNVLGGTSTDDFIFDDDYQLTSINGGGGANSVTGPDTVTTWGITGSTTGTINPGSGSTTLTNIQTFIGGSNDDTFNLSPNITVPTIQAGLGDNTLTFLAGWTSAAMIDLNTTTDFHTINGPGIVGSSLTGNNLANTWHITNDDSGTLENTTYPLGDLFNFTGFPNVIGGTSTDDFIFDSNYQLTSIDGGTGTNTLQGPDLTNTWTITGDNAGTVEPAGASGSTNFSRVGAFLGGTVADNYTFNAPFRIDGSGLVAGTGTNTLTGPDVINAWRITADGTGTILPNGSSGITHFSGMGSLTGGSQIDGFAFLAPAQILNGIDGGGSQNNSVAGPNVINTWAITNNNTGTLSPSGAGTTNLTNIENFVGGSLADTFTFNASYQLEGLAGIVGNGGGNILNAPNSDNTWIVSGNNAGSIFPSGAPGATKFSFIPQITGGSMMDTITFTADAVLTLGIDGGGGTNQVTGPDSNTAWIITADNEGTINPAAVGTTSLTNIQVWEGGTQDDTFTFSNAFQISGGIQGGNGNNTIQGPNVITPWAITGNDQGNLNPTGATGPTSFTDIGTLLGGSAADNFTFSGAGYLSGATGIQGGGGINSLTGPNLGNTWTVTGLNSGTLFPTGATGTTSFADIAQINGGSANDDITFTTNASLTQGIDGGGGTNQVTGPDLTTTWAINGNNTGTINPGIGPTTLTNIQQFIGGSQMDTFNFAGDFQLAGGIDGGGGPNIVSGPNIPTTWTINGPTSGAIDPGSGATTLTNVQTFAGGTNDDTFNLSPDITLPTIQAGLGSNTLTYLAGWTVPAIIDLTTTTGFQVINGPPGLNGNTLIGHNLSNTWHITADNSGTLENAVYPAPNLFTFTNFPNVTGGSTTDSFIFDGPYRLSGTSGIAAGGESNSMTVPNTVNNWTIEGNNAGTIFPTGASGSTVFSGIPTLTGGSMDDTFQFNGAYQISGGIVGNGGTNTVIGPDAINNWTISGNNSGTLAPPLPTGPTSLNGIQNFTGGSQEDHFQFTGPYRLTSIDGGGGVNNSLTGPNTVTTWNIMTTTTGTIEPLTSPGATNYSNIDILNGGFGNDTFILAANTAPPTVSAGSGANTLNFDPGWTIAVTIDLNVITGFQTINATAGPSNVLIGNDLPNTWHFIADDTGTLENSTYLLPTPFSFSNFPNVTGGSDNDSFIFDSAVHLTGAGIDAGGGSNSITSPAINTTWNVTSQTDGSINIGGSDQTTYVNVSSLNGSSANDTFNLSPNITLPAIHADSGSNTLNFLAGWSTPVTIDLNSIQAFQAISAPPSLNNILVGNDDINQWHITNDNAGTLENTFYPFPTVFTFSNFPILTGGSLDDTFTFDGLHQVNSIEGGAGGTNTIFGPDTDNTWTIATTNGGTLNSTGITSPISFTDIQSLVGGSIQDDFKLNNGTVSQVDGGLGTNSIESLNSTWLITANDAGSVDGMAFVNVGNLIGGSSDDYFVFSDGITLSGQVDGGAPASGNTLDYSAFTTPVTITLTGPSSGTATNLDNGFINIGQFVGNYVCTNCPSPPVVVRTFSAEKAQGLRTDLMLALTKEIEYFEWSYDQILFYNIFKTVLNTVLVSENLVQWQIEDKMTPCSNHLFEMSKERL